VERVIEMSKDEFERSMIKGMAEIRDGGLKAQLGIEALDDVFLKKVYNPLIIAHNELIPGNKIKYHGVIVPELFDHLAELVNKALTVAGVFDIIFHNSKKE
jgi:hypothetical protein